MTSRVRDPIRLFAQWFARARKADPAYHNAMILSTAGRGGAPSARVVLLKGFDRDGFVFFTNYRSRKGRELAADGRVALVFWWPALKRQVRIEGRALRVSQAVSEAYFSTRPRGSQIGAWASAQSAPIAGHAALVARVRRVAARYAGRPVPCPPHWGGFCVAPAAIEFWTERASRLHERLAFRRDARGRWTVRRLSP